MRSCLQSEAHAASELFQLFAQSWRIRRFSSSEPALTSFNVK